MKFCKDCKHYGRRGGFIYHCVSDGVTTWDDSVTGKTCEDEESYNDPYGQRRYGTIVSFLFGRCGKSGRFYEERLDK